MDEQRKAERRRDWRLSDEEMAAVVAGAASAAAEKAADLVFERFYAEVGKGVLKRVVAFLFLILASVASYLTGKHLG